MNHVYVGNCQATIGQLKFHRPTGIGLCITIWRRSSGSSCHQRHKSVLQVNFINSQIT